MWLSVNNDLNSVKTKPNRGQLEVLKKLNHATHPLSLGAYQFKVEFGSMSYFSRIQLQKIIESQKRLKIV